jgi:hypothetical protein
MLRGGRFVLLEKLGEGAQGSTWDAVDKREGTRVAIKRFDVRGARAWKDVELAEREARVLASLSHPKLPRYVDHFEEEGVLYLVMEKIEGTPLSVLQKEGRVREEQVVRLLRDASDILGYLHGRAPPVFHRDLKPSNVILRPDGSFAFVDFGAVRERLRPEAGSTVVGTFGYMAPEQFQGRAGPATDVYAVGATALAVLTGQEPEKLPHRGLAIDVRAALGGRASRGLQDVLVRMLEPNPDERPGAIGPLLSRLDGGAPSAERPQRRTRKQARRARRQERHEQRRAARAARRERWGGRPPWFAVLAVTLALALGQVAIAIATRVVVPLLLVVLSLVFGRGLRVAAQRVAEAGDKARAAMSNAARAVRGRVDEEEYDEQAGEHLRVETAGETNVRVEADGDARDEDDELKEPAGSAARRHRR